MTRGERSARREPIRSADHFHDATACDRYAAGAHAMQLAIAQRLRDAGLFGAAATALSTTVPAAPREATGLDYRGG